MKVTVIGAGNMGSAFVKQLVRAGHQVSVTARAAPRRRRLPRPTPAPRPWRPLALLPVPTLWCSPPAMPTP